MREETDFLGTLSLPDDALYGIHALRAARNFPGEEKFHPEWYRALALVKLAAYRCIKAFKKAASSKVPLRNMPAGMENMAVFNHLEEAAEEASAGKYIEHFLVPAIQGGAGTSANMNMNEILANAALLKMGHSPGQYEIIDPYRHANLFQSTNDVVPAALKIAVMQQLTVLEEGINALRSIMEELEREHRHSMRMAYTQMQKALPSSYGVLFSTYNEALARDWWRVSKCFERIKVVNLGGGATGSGLSIPRYYIMEVVHHLQQLTSMPVTRSENLADTTQNMDALAEVHGILKSHAVNLEKIASDMRLLSSDIAGDSGVRIPERQAGSSIMPGKVNPVIPEFVISVAHKVYSNDVLVASLCGQGCLDLNAYTPTMGHAILDSLKSLIAAGKSMRETMFGDLLIEPSRSMEKVLLSPSITTVLIPYLGYQDAGRLARTMTEEGCTIFAANEKLRLMEPEQLRSLMTPENLLKLGYSVKNKG